MSAVQASIATASSPGHAGSAPLRVLLALPGAHRVARGAEVAIEEVARALASDGGFDVTVIGSGPERAGEPYRFRHVGCIRREFFEKWPSVPYLRGLYAYEELTFAPGLFKAYRPQEFDATLTCSYPYVNWVLRGRRRKLGGRPKHVFVTQNGDWMVRAANWEFKHFGCDGLVCINPEYYERHRERYRCALIPNGVDPELFKPADGPDAQAEARRALGLPADGLIVLMVSALIASKRVLEGIRAVARMGEARLVIAGDGELRQAVDDLGAELLPGRFHRLTLPRQRMPELYRAADVCLHMSMDEPFGNVYVEAMSSGLPIVGHDWPVTRWIVGDAGLVVDTQSESAVAEALRRAMDLRGPEQVARRRRRVAERFAWASVGRQYGQFLREICRPDGGQGADRARDGGTKGQRDEGTKGRRDEGTKGRSDVGTKGWRDTEREALGLAEGPRRDNGTDREGSAGLAALAARSQNSENGRDEGTRERTDQGSEAPRSSFILPPSSFPRPTIGVVAIGRNEGERLRQCLASVRGSAAAVVYVDSGSTDGSVEVARGMGVEVVELDLATPFTAARARNEGFARLMQLAPGLEFVQVVDGDCEIAEGWLDKARAALEADSGLAIAAGRRRERHPEASVYNALCDVEWDTPVGPTTWCGGDALVRARALAEVEGYNAQLIAGEEPELCLRLRQKGWTILRVDAEMTLHDAAMTRFGQWWKRMVRCGHAFAEGAFLHGRLPERYCVAETRRGWVWGLWAPLLALAAAWPTRGLSLLLLGAYPAMGWRTYRHYLRRGLPGPLCRRVAWFGVLGKFPQAVGQLKFLFARLTGRRNRLIEYKGNA